jgi:hypothetical protein
MSAFSRSRHRGAWSALSQFTASENLNSEFAKVLEFQHLLRERRCPLGPRHSALSAENAY